MTLRSWRWGGVLLLLLLLGVLVLGGLLAGGGRRWTLAFRLSLDTLGRSQLRAMAEAGEELFWAEREMEPREGMLHLVNLLEVQRFLLLKGDLSPDAYRDLLRVFLDPGVQDGLPDQEVFVRQLNRFVRRLDNLGRLEASVDLGFPVPDGEGAWLVPVIRHFQDSREQYLIYRLRWEGGRPVLLPRSRWVVRPFRLVPQRAEAGGGT